MSSRQRQKKKRARLSKTERAHRNRLAKADAMRRAIERALVKKDRPQARPGLWARFVNWITK